VTVCPTQAIVAGDLDNPQSRISTLVGREPIQVRKPEKGTRPKLFYIQGDADSLVPSAAPPASDYMWAQAPQVAPGAGLPGPLALPLTEDAGAPRRTYGVREQHRNSWGWKVSVYLWTKSLAAGVFLVPALLSFLHPMAHPLRPGISLLAGVFLAVTGLLLIADLRQPRRFLWTLTRPQWRSWLTRGSYLIGAYGLLLGVHVLLGLAGTEPPRLLTVAAAAFAVLTAVYTAFLFGQAKGRDLWQSPLLAPHLVVQAPARAIHRPGGSLAAALNGLFVAEGLIATPPRTRAAATSSRRRALHPASWPWVPAACSSLVNQSRPLAGASSWQDCSVEHLCVQAPRDPERLSARPGAICCLERGPGRSSVRRRRPQVKDPPYEQLRCTVIAAFLVHGGRSS
jgi:hypothetical protein